VIRGYVEQPSPRPGGWFTLRVATDAPQFRVEFYRYGAALSPCGAVGPLPGQDAPLHLPFQDWGQPGVDLDGHDLPAWAGYRFAVPPHWRSGVYVAVLVEGDGPGPRPPTVDARDARALFVVRPPVGATPAPILYKLPVLTYHAYNVVDGQHYDPTAGCGHWCLYNTPAADEVPAPIEPGVSLHRPGGGTGGTPYDIALNPDPFDPTPRQTFQHWDARFIAWLERAGYRADYCTDVDLHRDGLDLVAPHRLLLSVGHDEYWSDAMRDALDAYVDGGGNAAFFGGNICWWRVVFHDDVTFSRVENWHDTGRPENTSIGVSFRNGGERDRDEHPVPVGYRVQHADHWLYRNTGLRDGDQFGAGAHEYLVGYECDGAAFDRADLAAGRPVRPTGEDGTPDDFTILAVGDTRPSGWGLGNAAATLGLRSGPGPAGPGPAGPGPAGRGQPGRGQVFTAATTDWARVLTAGPTHEATTTVLDRITRNVLDRLTEQR
jgi:hypothetical protein